MHASSRLSRRSATVMAIDKIDPFHRKSDPNRTLSAMGVSPPRAAGCTQPNQIRAGQRWLKEFSLCQSSSCSGG